MVISRLRNSDGFRLLVEMVLQRCPKLEVLGVHLPKCVWVHLARGASSDEFGRMMNRIVRDRSGPMSSEVLVVLLQRTKDKLRRRDWRMVAQAPKIVLCTGKNRSVLEE